MTDTTLDTEHGAKVILANEHVKHEPQHYYTDRRKAAEALVKAFLRLATEGKLAVKEIDTGGHAIGFGSQDGLMVWVGVHNATPVLGAVDVYGRGRSEASFPEIEYDPIAQTFIGKAVDTNIAPTPGQPLPRVRPLTVLARLAVEVLEKHTKK